ncbi:hypothetical protein BDW02DRAFT_192836 [Decorospora gaudefroyi]|uniref:MFS general substrate transporter n=1 Tax=Decorospora gaudefroyi TaxID=184978 RepID=A0A6A5K378_9PLEO|nr:hypothetical protein BDW02DRAFT_192836 [Decorospora gaudefroyi]
MSIWAPLRGLILDGFSNFCILVPAYMYMIDNYKAYAASASTFVGPVRYLAAGGRTFTGIPRTRTWELIEQSLFETYSLPSPTPYQNLVPVGLSHSAPRSSTASIGLLLHHQPLNLNASAFVSGICACVIPMGSFIPHALGARKALSLTFCFSDIFCFLLVWVGVSRCASALRFCGCVCAMVLHGRVRCAGSGHVWV